MPRITQQKIDTCTIDKDGTSRGRQVFDIEAFSALDAAKILLQERGITYGVPYQNMIGEAPDPRLRVMAITPSAKTPPVIGKEALYEVDVQYSIDGEKSGSGSSKPKLGEVLYRWGSAYEEREIFRDKNGEELRNPRGDLYEGITLPVPHRTLEALWWTKSASLSWLFDYDAAVNKGGWKIKGIYSVQDGYALCRGMDPSDDANFPEYTLITGRFEFAVPGEPYNPKKFRAFAIIGGRRRLLKSDGSIATSIGDAKQETLEVVPDARLKDFNAIGI